ncbi:dTDP-4-dehydrorhamnose 3,5-epimerase [Paenalcaligenes hominis]|uniref:dTDP-4-dehydrorhamnose 3,5-epimerase n=1 Tax=Paenalcaligenes hominis TaxID=643674 RepID=UPI003524BC0F
MQYIAQRIPDVVLLQPTVLGDERGFFMESFRKTVFQQHCGAYEFVQENYSRSGQGVLRGLHYQYHQPQGKLVRVTAGEVYDVAVDLRADSSTFGQWVGVYLSAENKNQLWIPPGFAHGFYVLSAHADLHYKCTAYYAPHDEQILRWDDPSVGIEWPLVTGSPVLSVKDQHQAQPWATCKKYSVALGA